MSSFQEEYKQHILEVIAKVQLGQATEAEVRELDEWYEQSPNGEKYTEGMSTSEKLQARNRMLHRINSMIYKEAVPIHKINPYKKLKKYALVAVMLLIVGTGWFLYQKDNNPFKVEQTFAKIVPGSNKAILTLGNGKKISLTDAVSGKLASQSGMHIIKTANGQLIYQTFQEGNSTSSDVVQYNKIEVPVGGQWQVILADGSHVWLNALSSMIFPTKFTGRERRIEIKGEAYFEIAHDKDKPFRVTSSGQTVEVLGTHFNVMAYADEHLVKTTLLEGSIRVSKRGFVKILKPGQQAQSDVSGITVKTNVDLEDVVAWKNGYFKFSESLESVMNKIARWYDVEIEYATGINKQKKFGGKISRSKDISSALRIMELTGKVHFQIEGRRIIVKN